MEDVINILSRIEEKIAETNYLLKAMYDSADIEKVIDLGCVNDINNALKEKLVKKQ